MDERSRFHFSSSPPPSLSPRSTPPALHPPTRRPDRDIPLPYQAIHATGSTSALPTERCRERRSHTLVGRPPASTMRHRGVGYAQGRARSGERPVQQPSCPDEGARMAWQTALADSSGVRFFALAVFAPGAFQSHISLYNTQSRGRDDAQCPASGPEHVHPSNPRSTASRLPARAIVSRSTPGTHISQYNTSHSAPHSVWPDIGIHPRPRRQRCSSALPTSNSTTSSPSPVPASSPSGTGPLDPRGKADTSSP